MTSTDHDAFIDRIAGNIAEARGKILEAQKEARRGGEVAIVAVSKQQPEARLRAALDAGQRIFGENRVQEAALKWPALRDAYAGVELHLVGPLQSNKAAEAVSLFDVIETVDRDKIAAAIAAECARQGRRVRLFVQVNTGEEPQKSGVAPAEVSAFIARCRDVHGLEIDGLMCIPPADEPPAPHFALLAKLAFRCGVRSLSMGMSGDYPIAVQFGATHVRIGEAIFGARKLRSDRPAAAR